MPRVRDSAPLAYFITFRAYGTWLHGDERGAVDRRHNDYGTPYLPVDEDWKSQNVARSRKKFYRASGEVRMAR